MTRQILLRLSALFFVALLVWGKVLSMVFDLVGLEMSTLTYYLINKGLFVAALLAALGKWDGLRNYGFVRCRNWWFLLPGAPFLVLTVLVMIVPESPFGLGLAAALGWILVSIFVGIGEEGLFRGLIWRAVEDRGMLATSLLTSALFGAVHLTGLFTDIPWQTIVSMAFFAAGGGMLFAAVRLVSGSLMAPIFMHAIFDAGAIVAAGGMREMISDTMSVGRLLIPGAAFFVWGLICVLVIQRRRRNANSMPTATEVS